MASIMPQARLQPMPAISRSLTSARPASESIEAAGEVQHHQQAEQDLGIARDGDRGEKQDWLMGDLHVP